MKLRKAIVALVLALVTVANCAGVLAAEVVSPVQPVQTQDEGVSPHTEETEWRVRWYEGRRQRRLWSITNECWLTEWEDF